jgi:hypothetical protein
MMRKQQRGMTALGVIILLALGCTLAFGVIQLVPVYLESMKIAQVLNQAKSDLEGQSPSVVEIRKSLGKRVNIEDLHDVDYVKDFKITRTGGGFTVSTEYSRKRLFFGNLYLLTEFNHSVEILR